MKSALPLMLLRLIERGLIAALTWLDGKRQKRTYKDTAAE